VTVHPNTLHDLTTSQPTHTKYQTQTKETAKFLADEINTMGAKFAYICSIGGLRFESDLSGIDLSDMKIFASFHPARSLLLYVRFIAIVISIINLPSCPRYFCVPFSVRIVCVCACVWCVCV
jgi:hypothetical protein